MMVQESASVEGRKRKAERNFRSPTVAKYRPTCVELEGGTGFSMRAAEEAHRR
jgi:hypothetical protein